MLGLAQRGKNNPNIAYLYATLGFISQALIQILFKHVVKAVSAFTLLFFRGFILFLINDLLLRNRNETPFLKDESMFRKVLKRVLCVGIYTTVSNYCVKELPASTVITFQNTGPIMIFLVQMVEYKKPLDKVKLLFTLISFVGVLLVIQPQFLLGKHSSDLQASRQIYLSFLVIFGTLAFSISMVILHNIANKLSMVQNLQYSNMSQMLYSTILWTGSGSQSYINASLITIDRVVCFVFLVFFTFTAQHLINSAAIIKKPSSTMPFGYCGVLVGFLADVFFFKIDFNFWAILGIVMTSAGLLSNIFVSQPAKDITQSQKQLKQQIKNIKQFK